MQQPKKDPTEYIVWVKEALQPSSYTQSMSVTVVVKRLVVLYVHPE
jgi:hypothetical protein